MRVDVDFEPMKVRIAENECLFRSANERIELEAQSIGYRDEKVPFVCECPDLSCTDIVQLTVEDYENIRSGPTRFFVVPGHQAIAVQAGAAIVIEERDDVCISEKIGVAGEVAASDAEGSYSLPGNLTFEAEREARPKQVDAPDRARQATAVGNAITRLHREYYGRGATTTRTVYQRNHIVVFLEDIYTPVERTLIDAGSEEDVKRTRQSFQMAMQERFSNAVEDITGRKVIQFMSQNSFDPDMAAEIFVLEPETGDSAGENGHEDSKTPRR